MHFVTVESVQQNYAVVRCGQKQVIAVVAELHALDFVVVLGPVSKRASFKFRRVIKRDAHDLLVFLMLTPRNAEHHSKGVKIGHRVSGHAL